VRAAVHGLLLLRALAALHGSAGEAGDRRGDGAGGCGRKGD